MENDNSEILTMLDVPTEPYVSANSDVQITPDVPHTKKRRKGGYEKRKQFIGYLFIGIWLIGIICFFLIPVATSLRYSLSTTTLVGESDVSTGGGAPGIKTEWNNFAHYKSAVFVNGDFTVSVVSSLLDMLPRVALVLVFSLFSAVLLSQKFRSRGFFRAIFFLPVLIATGPVISIINGDIASSGNMDATQFNSMFRVDFLSQFMSMLGIAQIGGGFADFAMTITNDIFGLVWKSGIQIFIFLAALSQIPRSAREAATIEGATEWDFFWRITLPSISPMLLAALIYTVIDAFVDYDNKVMQLVLQQVYQLNYGYGAALGWIYFGIVAAALAIVLGIANKFISYDNFE